MSTSPNLPPGAFITSLGGRRCTALPRTDVSTQASTSTASTSTLSPLPAILSSSSSLLPLPSLPPSSSSKSTAVSVSAPPQVLATAAAATSPPPVVTTSSASIAQFSINASSPEAVSSPAVTTLPQTQASVADTSNAASSTVPAVVATPAQSEVLGTDVSSTSAVVFTTIGLNNPSSAVSSATISSDAPGSTTTLVAVSGGSSSGRSGQNNSTVAIAGGVIGGMAVIGLIAFFIWFWRRRILRKRRSTLLTPLSADPSFGAALGEKRGPYAMARGSLGLTPRSNKVKDSLRSQLDRVRGRFDTIKRSGSIRSNASHTSGRSVDMNRGNSQFMDTSPMMNGRKGSNASAMPTSRPDDMSIKERVMDIWGRFRGGQPNTPTLEDQNRNDIFAARGLGGSIKSSNSASSKTRPLTNKPDFLTLLNMDDGELDREAQRRRVSRTRDGGGGSLGGLNLDLGNPFSDANAIPRKQGAGPLVVPAADNPFSDTNAMAEPTVPKPASYISDVRRSRGMSVGTASVDLEKSYDLHGLRVVNEVSRPPSGVTGVGGNPSMYYNRDSSVSLESFATKRNKFRSDPFDLEPLSYVSDNPLTRPAMPDTKGRYSDTDSISVAYRGSSSGAPKLPAAAHTRNASDLSSRYTSGISDATFDEWSDPGPDVGPGAQNLGGRWEASRRSSTVADPFSPLGGGSGGGSSRPYDSRSDSRSSGKSSLKMGYAL